MENGIHYQKKVNEIICNTLTIERIDPDQDLFESGLLDSLALVELIVALEKGFEISISASELDIDDYRSVYSISLMIENIAGKPAVTTTG